MRLKIAAGTVLVLMLSVTALSQTASKSTPKVPKGAKVLISAMPNGFDTYLHAAIAKKKVPVEVVEDKSKAQFQITGTSDTQKAGVAKKVLALDWRSTEEASIQIANLETGEVVYAYSVHLQSSNSGKQSSAESCAKHMKDNAF